MALMPAAPMIGAAESAEYEWSNVPIGANGFVTGIVIHPNEPDLVYIRTDVGGCFRYNSAEQTWIPLNDSFSLDWSSLYQIDGIALDPNDPDVIYVAAGGPASYELSDILKSEDRGQTWERLGFDGGVFSGNGSCRGWGECIAIHPENSNVIYCGTYDTGLWRSRDGGYNWEQLFNSETPIRSVIFGSGSEVYAAGQNAYLWRSDNGGDSWEQDTSAPASIKRMAAASDGTVYMASESGLWKYTDGTFENISPSDLNGTYNAITVAPDDDGRIICIGPHTQANEMNIPFWESLDGGDTWTQKSSTRRVNSMLPWDPQENSTMNISSNAHCIVMDPHKPERVWISDWFCVSMTEDISAQPYQQWDYLYKGLELVCIRDMLCPPSGELELIAGIADIDGVVYTDTDGYPLRRIRQNRQAPWLMSTSALDYCAEAPNIVLRTGVDYNMRYKAEISFDNTETWNDIVFRKASNPNEEYEFTQFGQAAVSAEIDPDTGYPSLVIIPSGRVPIVSHDGGKTWSESQGITDTAISTQYWDKGIYLAADGADGDTFYIADRGQSCNIYVSRDGGDTWQRTAALGGAWYVDKTFIKSAPGLAGEVWCCSGGRYLYKSSDYGRTWSQVSGIREVQCFGFGKNAPGSSFPTVYAYGTYQGVVGVYRSTDAGASWQRINNSDWNMGRGTYVIEGDMRTFGTVYIGTGGRGLYKGVDTAMNAASVSITGCTDVGDTLDISYIPNTGGKDALAYCAAYNRDGSLAGVSVSELREESSGKEQSSSVEVSGEVAKVKVFLWDDDMRPLCDSSSLTLSGRGS